MRPSARKIANLYIARLEREAGVAEVWSKWIAQPFKVILKHHKDFVHGPVDDAIDAIIKEIAPLLVKQIGEEEVDEDVDEFTYGAIAGRKHKLDGTFFDPRHGHNQDPEWQEGYEWGWHHAHEFKGALPPRKRKEVIQEALKDFRHRITEEVLERMLKKIWHAISPVTTVKAILKAVKKHGWKMGVGFALFEIFEHAVLPAILIAITGNPKWAVVGTLPIGEIIYAVVLRWMGRVPKELDRANPDGHLDWYEDKFGPVRIASVDFPSFEEFMLDYEEYKAAC